MRRVSALLLALVLIASFLCVSAFAEQNETAFPSESGMKNVCISNLRCKSSLSGSRMSFKASFSTNEAAYCNVRIDLERAATGSSDFQYVSNLKNEDLTGNASGNKSYTVSASATKASGYKYRAKVTVRAYNSHDVLLDSDSVYSAVIE